MATASPPPGIPVTQPLAPSARRYAIGMLLVIYIFNFLDRQIVNILAEPIKIELGLADWQLGMLTGLAFAAFYTVLGIPIARYAEKADRVKIISVAVGVWSLFTIACGLAANFTQLLLARIGVGVGEAGCSPPAHSLITDYTPKEERASALAIYSMGIPLGSLAGMALGGLIADAFGWRVAFFVAGAPGIILSIMAFLTLPEPRRGLEKKVVPVKGPSFADALRELKSKKSFWWISIGAALSAMVGYGHIAFYGSFYLRNHGEGLTAMAASVNEMIGVSFGPIGFVGTALGLIIGICGAAGTFLGGVLADRAARKNVSGYATVPAIAGLVTVIPFIAAMLVDNVALSFLFLAIPVFAGAIWYGPIFASAQSLVHPQTRATAAAVLLFIINLVGLGLGPLLVGTFSDIFAQTMGAAEGIRWSMVVFGGMGGIASIAFFLAARTLKDEVVA
ncbi:spinster family MFS transporter [Glycocaulis alkaliphilus]|uniref:spinster family MFS transporter n=1 Tax=Glycocaulis alkaliphilus TaxID=1434191 RepID=UPI0019CB40BF|nr:MFS transporter [Glycocaulis alkaliphilus]GGB65317.1 MFS transporter [Glycocaulis alkaliphilus]